MGQRRDARRLLVVAVDHLPRRPARVRLREHCFDRGEIILALRPVAIIFRPGLPAFPRIVEPRGEALVLLLLREDRKSTRLKSSHYCASRMPSSDSTKTTSYFI